MSYFAGYFAPLGGYPETPPRRPPVPTLRSLKQKVDTDKSLKATADNAVSAAQATLDAAVTGQKVAADTLTADVMGWHRACVQLRLAQGGLVAECCLP